MSGVFSDIDKFGARQSQRRTMASVSEKLADFDAPENITQAVIEVIKRGKNKYTVVSGITDCTVYNNREK